MWIETLEKVRLCKRQSSREAGGVCRPAQAASVAGLFSQSMDMLRKGKMMSQSVE